jgi:hypothetical protein
LIFLIIKERQIERSYKISMIKKDKLIYIQTD